MFSAVEFVFQGQVQHNLSQLRGEALPYRHPQ